MKREIYIGVDVSKNWLDLAYYDGVDIDWKSGHIRVDNNKSGYRKISIWLKKLQIAKGAALFCMEYTGLYCYNFRIWLESEGITYGMVNPRKMHRFEPDLGEGEPALDRIKTDEMDSFRIAIYCEKHSRKIKSSPSRLPGPAFFNLKRLLAERRQYVKHSVLYKQQLNDISAYDTEESCKRKQAGLKSLSVLRRQTDIEMREIIKSDEAIYKNYKLLCSVIGVGLVIAVETIVLTENFTAITNPRKYACYVGIAPGRKESGISIKGGDHVSKKGFKQAKANLSLVALQAIRHDSNIRGYWLRRKADGKHTGVVLNAIKFKMILRMFAVIKRQKPYVEMEKYRK